MTDQLTMRYLRLRMQAANTHGRLCDDRGEGVISVAIAILVIAFIGALMFVGLRDLWEDTETKTINQLDSIGG